VSGRCGRVAEIRDDYDSLCRHQLDRGDPELEARAAAGGVLADAVQDALTRAPGKAFIDANDLHQ
jgi:hypothetical protein